MSKASRAVLIALVITAALTPRAFAHGERGGSDPKAGARLGRAPGSVTVSFTEPPTGDGKFEVTDGCGRDVVTDLKIQNTEIEATLAGGQPGKWNVSWKIVSGLDGHPSSDGYKFSVAGGEPDCSVPAPAESGGRGSAAGDEPSGRSNIPWIPIAVGSVVLVGAAVLLRRSGG